MRFIIFKMDTIFIILLVRKRSVGFYNKYKNRLRMVTFVEILFEDAITLHYLWPKPRRRLVDGLNLGG